LYTLLQHSLRPFASSLGGQFATELGGQFLRNIQLKQDSLQKSAVQVKTQGFFKSDELWPMLDVFIMPFFFPKNPAKLTGFNLVQKKGLSPQAPKRQIIRCLLILRFQFGSTQISC
jgi:hypothetical protein